MSRLLLRSRSSLSWSAAAVTAAALYAVPWALAAGLAAVWWAALLLPAVLVVLATVAWRLWSPVVVLGAGILSIGGAAAFFLINAVGETCGDSGTAHAISWLGGVAVALAVGASGVRRGFWAYPAVLVGWIAAAVWFVAVAHLVPGGTGACLE